MLQKKSLQPALRSPPEPSSTSKMRANELAIVNKIAFEHRGNRTVLAKPYDQSYSQKQFSIKDNLYGATFNTSQLQSSQPNLQIKLAMRKQF